MMTITPLISEFTTSGKLQDITVKSDGRIKSLLIDTENEQYSIKVGKDQAKNIAKQLQIGCQLEVKGLLKHNPKKDTATYKAFSIKLMSPPAIKESSQVKELAAKSSKKKKSKAKVLICQKSNCWKKGGKKVYQQLQSELEQRGIADDIEIKTTGCLKKCKKAPNVIILPDKEHYVKIKPQQVSKLVEQHLA